MKTRKFTIPLMIDNCKNNDANSISDTAFVLNGRMVEGIRWKTGGNAALDSEQGSLSNSVNMQ